MKIRSIPSLFIRFTVIALAASFLSHCNKIDEKYKRELEQSGTKFSEKNFIIAADNDDFNKIELFVKAGMDPDTRYYYRGGGQVPKGWTPLMLSAKHGRLDIVKFLVDHDADVNATWSSYMGPSISGFTAIMLASENGHVDVVRYLIDRGADVNERTSPRKITALIQAAKNGNLNIVKLLVKAGADLDVQLKGTETGRQLSEYGKTALMLAADKNYIDIVKYLHEQGDDIDQKRADGKTSLMLAVERESLPVIETLIQLKANVNIQDEDGKTALHLATQKKNVNLRIVDLLIKNGANPDLKEDKWEWTPLMIAAHNGQKAAVEHLLDGGANPKLKDRDSQTAADLASKSGFNDIAKTINRYSK